MMMKMEEKSEIKSWKNPREGKTKAREVALIPKPENRLAHYLSFLGVRLVKRHISVKGRLKE